jgi:hypothetical protein
MSHADGKIEVVGMTGTHTFFKFHRAADDTNSSRFMVRLRNRRAHWFDDYQRPERPAAPMGPFIERKVPRHPSAGLA